MGLNRFKTDMPLEDEYDDDNIPEIDTPKVTDTDEEDFYADEEDQFV